MSWKKVLLGILGVGVAGVAAVLAYGASQPKTWRVERSVVVAAAPEDLLPLLADLEQWPKWAGGPDAAVGGMTYTFGPTRRGPGATYTWSGAGSHGSVTLDAVDASGVSYAMTMEDSATPAHGTLRLSAEGEGTRVTWTDEGDFSGMGPLGGLMVPMMEKSLGPHVEGALGALGGLAVVAAAERHEAEVRAAASAAGAVEGTTASGDPLPMDAP